MSLRILILHNRYREPGGEDVGVAEQARLLKEKGHDVRLIEKSNTDINNYGLLRKSLLFFEMADNAASAAEVARVAAEFKPQAACVHNTLALLSPSVYRPLKEAGAKVIQFLHNYRLVCPAGILYHDGAPCTLCVEKDLRYAVEHSCWTGSKLATLGLTRTLQRHRRAGTWLRHVDLFVALNSYQRDILVKAGVVPAEKIIVQPYFRYPPEQDAQRDPEPGSGFVFVGRLVPEKGVHTLLRAQATDPSLSLRIVGDGPDSERLRAMAGKGVEFMGRVSHEQVLEHLRNARAVVVPSEWQEVFGAALLEAMALGKPVIASRVAGPQEIVEEGVTGLLFDPGNANSLASCMKRLQNDATLAAWLGKAGRERYWREYSPDAGYKRLLSIFERLQVEDKLA